MRKIILFFFFALTATLTSAANGPRVKVKEGVLEGVDLSGVKIFKGIPYAQPPVGKLRWKAPQPAVEWAGVRSAIDFGPNPIQYNPFPDMIFGTDKFSEDCLYLNVWTPSQTMDEKIPVLICFNGGSFLAGSGSEYRHEGLTLAGKGIIMVTANYRQGIFGFFCHPQLSKETSYHGSGNYGLMDMAAAIKWVKENIAAFGGDPDRITIYGESAGSLAVSALMTSPMSKHLINGVIGSSGSLLASYPPMTLKQAEENGAKWARKHRIKKFDDLRKLPAEQLNKMAEFGEVPDYCVDGKFFTENPILTFQKGEQAQVPALIGGNNAEMPVLAYLEGKAPTLSNLRELLGETFNTSDKIEDLLDLYDINNDLDIQKLQGYALGGDIFIGYSTWKWTDMLQHTSKKPVYRYLFCHPRPAAYPSEETPGAVHAADIDYSMGNLSSNKFFNWTADDYRVSEIFQRFYLNFVKHGNPNGLGLPHWEAINGKSIAPVMYIDVNSQMVENERVERRYKLIDQLMSE